MIRILNPKEQFQTLHTVEREEWAKTVGLRSTQLAFGYAVSEMTTLNFTDQQLQGARLFVNILQNISEKVVNDLNEKYPAQPLLEPGDEVPVAVQQET